MNVIPIPNLPAATAITGTEQIPANQGGTTVRLTSTQIASLGSGGSALIPSSLAVHSVLIGNGSSQINQTAVGATGQVLSGNSGADPTWATLLSLMTTVVNGLPTSRPGTSGILWNNAGVISVS